MPFSLGGNEFDKDVFDDFAKTHKMILAPIDFSDKNSGHKPENLEHPLNRK